MTQEELIEKIINESGVELSKADGKRVVKAVFTVIGKGVKKEDSVAVAGFGTFKKVKRAARKGRNPQTGEEIKIKASKSVTFKPSSVLKGSL